MTKELMEQVLDALKEALDKPMWNRPKMEKAIQALEEALKQEQDEPVAWLEENDAKAMSDLEKQAWIQAGRDELVETYNRPLYTKPKTKEWVKLTREEKYSIYIECSNCFIREPTWEDFANAVEAKLKELNK